MQYILGEWDFCGLNLKMAPPVFIPRPETEVGAPTGQPTGLARSVGFRTLVLPQTSSRGRWDPMAAILSDKPLCPGWLGRWAQRTEVSGWLP